MASLFGGAESELSIVVRLRDEASKHLQAMQGKFNSFHTHMQNAASASRVFGIGIGAAAGGVIALGGAAIKAAADMEQTRIAFQTMLGSAEKADVFIKDLVQFAKTTPFELRGLEESSKKLLAFGFAQEEVIPNLKVLGDITAGVGTDKLPQLILAFGQVKAATRLTGMELRQFTEAGVPLLDELAKQMGKTAGEVQEMVSNGEIGFDKVQKALMGLTAEGGRFENLMQKQSQSLGGMISNLKDAWDIFLRGEGQKLLEWAKIFVDIAIDIIQNHLPNWINRIEQVTQWLGEHKEVLIIVAGVIMGALVPALYAATVALVGLGIALAPYMLAGAAVGALVAGIIWVGKNWDKVWNGIKNTVQSAVDFIGQQIQRVINAYDRMKAVLVQPVKATIGGITGALKGLLGFEHGGTVPGPRGMPVPIMAHGQERIIPASGSGDNGKPMVLNFNFNGAVAGDDGIRMIVEQAISTLEPADHVTRLCRHIIFFIWHPFNSTAPKYSPAPISPNSSNTKAWRIGSL